ncbi:uncharacterized protein LOC141652882 [Silene latifolia]|uniref:uncharacterized protein LOC141652882 n=1 Tax=Silene latifolia TaxID=37657 RepID=UPI003D785F6F
MVYDFNGSTERQSLWANLSRLANNISGTWAIGGDFNCVLTEDERVGGSFSRQDAEDFRQCLHQCEVIDSPAMGALYTWNNKQCPTDRVYSRLDRFLVSQDWLNEFPLLYAHFLPEGTFDHTPCVVQANLTDEKRARPFKYFNMWSLAPNFKEIVQAGWNCMQTGTKMYELAKKLKNLKQGLKQLNKNRFADIESNAEVALTKLNKIQQRLGVNPQDLDLIQQECEARESYQQLAEAQNQFLQQKGNQHTDKKGVQESFLRIYTQLLGQSHPTTPVSSRVVQQGNKCDESHHQILLTPVTDAEIKSTIFSIPNDKAPGPDGYSSQFFKPSWDIVGGDVCAAVHECFRNGKMLKQLNATNVTLIPKVSNPLTVMQFRPIACCNVVYKCISKLLCSRLALVLPHLIYVTQGGFIQGRSIMENILICQDLVKLYGRKSVSSRCLFKIDLQKAYDSVEWSFLFQMMQELNIPTGFIALIKECVTTATYTLNLNGDSFGWFKGQRGLRQGDPLSPLIFTICMEYLTRLLAYTTSTMKFRGCGFHYDTATHFLNLLTSIRTPDELRKIECEGGLGLRDEYSWNKAAVGKLVWWIQAHPSKLWVQWVHSVYLKGQEWENYSPPQDASWTWKKVCKLKQEFHPAYHQNEWTMVPGKEYTIKKVYSWLRQNGQDVSWYHIVWTKWSIPKHSFIAWLYYQQGFNTKDKLFRLGISPDSSCCICAQEEESPHHLFFQSAV